MINYEAIALLAAFAVVLSGTLVLINRRAERDRGPRRFFGTVRRPADERLRSSQVWSTVASRLGAMLMAGPDGHRISFRWQGREAMIFEGDPVRFAVGGGDFGSLRADLYLGSSAGRRIEGIPEPVSVAGGEDADVRAFVTSPVARLLRDLMASGAGEVRIGDGVRITARLRPDADAVVRFSVLCLQFAQHVRMFAAQTSGVIVVETSSSAAGQCQICGAALDGRLVRCARCSTLHHRDCWQYTGACSTYGCGETTFVA